MEPESLKPNLSPPPSSPALSSLFHSCSSDTIGLTMGWRMDTVTRLVYLEISRRVFAFRPYLLVMITSRQEHQELLMQTSTKGGTDKMSMNMLKIQRLEIKSLPLYCIVQCSPVSYMVTLFLYSLTILLNSGPRGTVSLFLNQLTIIYPLMQSFYSQTVLIADAYSCVP